MSLLRSQRILLTIPFRFASVDKVLKETGYTRSLFCEPQFIEYVDLNGERHKITNGLVAHNRTMNKHILKKFFLNTTYRHDLDIAALKKHIRKYLINRNKERQRISAETIERLGVDVAIAKMICQIGGRVKFNDSQEWVQEYRGMQALIPTDYNPDRKLVVIDASGTQLTYEGLEHFHLLQELRVLRLKRCLRLNDFGLARVGRITKSKLQLLDVSDCPRISENGLTALVHLRHLRHLLVEKNPDMKEKELACLLLEDYIPRLTVTGVKYLGNLDEEQKNRVLQLTSAAVDNTLHPEAEEEEELESQKEKISA